MRTMVIPREHGAWGMLLVPLVSGAVVASRSGIQPAALALFIVAAMSLFWLRTPVESWLGTSPIKAQNPRERSVVRRASLGLGALGVATVAALLGTGHRGLLAIGIVAATAFVAQTLVKNQGRSGRMPAQVIGAIGLTSTAAGAYYVASGRFDHIAVALWLANWLFAADQIHFVQLRIRCSRAANLDEKLRQGLPFLLAQIVMIGAILAACWIGLFPAAAAGAFLPVLLRGTLWFLRKWQPLDVHKLGFTELGHALVFSALLCTSFLI